VRDDEVTGSVRRTKARACWPRRRSSLPRCSFRIRVATAASMPATDRRQSHSIRDARAGTGCDLLRNRDPAVASPRRKEIRRSTDRRRDTRRPHPDRRYDPLPNLTAWVAPERVVVVRSARERQNRRYYALHGRRADCGPTDESSRPAQDRRTRAASTGSTPRPAWSTWRTP
jgi:hypothetical protein